MWISKLSKMILLKSSIYSLIPTKKVSCYWQDFKASWIMEFFECKSWLDVDFLINPN